MDRRTLLKAAAVGVGVGGAAGAGAAQIFKPAPAAGGVVSASRPGTAGERTVRRLSMVTSWPKNLPGLGAAADRLAALIGQLSGGELEVRVYAAGEVVGAFDVFDAVSNGAADLYHAADYYWQGKAAAYPFFTAVPFGLSAQEQLAWIEWGGGQDLWNELSAQFNIIPMMGANTGVQMGGWFKREITGLSDVRGLKMRIPGIGGEVWRALGGAAVAMPGGEIYGALQSGLIDGAEWVGPWNDFFLGFYREAPFYYGPGFHEPGAALACGVNRKVWESLRPSDQAVLRAAAQAVTAQSVGEFHHQNAAHLDVLLTQHGVQLRRFPDDLARAAGEAANDIINDIGASDGLSRRIRDSFLGARKKLNAWSTNAEGAYYQMRASAL
jgi:TRAP-type mannitol/chloroaromatic compound transport system substrate-binding protein